MDCFVLGSALDVAAPDEPWQSGAEVGPELAAALATGGGQAGARGRRLRVRAGGVAARALISRDFGVFVVGQRR